MNNKVKMSGVNQLPSIDKIFKDDDDDFTPSVGSNLATIFGTPQKSQEPVSSNSPSRYASKKQSAGGQNASQTSAATKKEVILAKAVHAFKLQNGQYASIGKVGIALIGNSIARQYDVILYKGTQDYISIVAITSDFSYTVQANNYSSYYDANKDNWSILFENGEASAQFAREICLSRYFSRPGRIDGSAIYQDLSATDKDAIAKEGDGISIKYLTSVDMCQPLKIDNNLKQTITLEISKDDNWERLLVGTSLGLKRIMILPPNKQIGLGPGFPKEREIIMEIEVVSVFAKEDLPPPISKPPEVSQKATIISRMAKMGQSILPKLPPSTTTDSEDTEEEVFRKASRHKRAESADSSQPKKHSYSNQSPDVASQKRVLNRGELMPATLPIAQRQILATPAFAPQWAQGQIQQYVSVDGHLLPIQQQTIAQPISASMDPTMSIFLSETRTQNTELRMGLSKIGDNVQKLLDKFHVLELHQASSPASDKSLETTLKMFMDLNKSKENVESKHCEVQCVLKNDEVPEVDENLLSTNKELISKLNAIKNELKQANESLATKSVCINELSLQNDGLKQTNTMLTDQIKELEEKLSASEGRVIDLFNELEESKEIGSKYQEENSKLENCVSELTIKCKEMEQNMRRSENSDWVDKSKEIKEIMTEIFQELIDSFPDAHYTTDYIKSTIHSTLRSITFRIMSEETEKKRERARRNKEEEAAASILKSNANENSRENDVHEDITAITPNDILNSNNTSESRKEPPPLPEFDLDAAN